MPRSGAARTIKDSAEVFAALGDDTRLRVVARLSEEGPLSIARLTQGSRMTRQAITKHLQVLAGAGVVKNTRDGRETLWQLQPKSLSEARRLLDGISREWDGTLERLRAYVEQEDWSASRKSR